MFCMKFKKETRITFLYIIIGLGWIFFSDYFLLLFFKDQNMINRFQSYKGIFYVLITAYLFYLILHRTFKNIRMHQRKLKSSHELLALDNEQFRMLNKKISKANQELQRQKEKLSESYQLLEADNEEFKELNKELEESYNEINELANNIEKMINITSGLNSLSVDNTDLFLSDLLNTALKLIDKANQGAIARIIDDNLVFIDSVDYEIEKLNQLNLKKSFVNKINGIKTLTELFKDDISAFENSKFYERYQKLLREINDSIIVSFNNGQEKAGVICLLIDKRHKQKFDENSHRTMSAFSSLASVFFKIQKYHQVEEEFQEELIVAITGFLELHDTYTDGHSREVAELSRKIAREMNLSDQEVEKAYWAGMIHDIGKILIPETILVKNGPLTSVEYNKIKKHPIWGYQALKHSGRLKEIAEIILYHHERWDGSGYPYGLKEDEIPLIARILCVADSWNAMRSNRPYRSHLPINKALEELRDNNGSQFCPEVVEAFFAIMGEQIAI